MNNSNKIRINNDQNKLFVYFFLCKIFKKPIKFVTSIIVYINNLLVSMFKT